MRFECRVWELMYDGLLEGIFVYEPFLGGQVSQRVEDLELRSWVFCVGGFQFCSLCLLCFA